MCVPRLLFNESHKALVFMAFLRFVIQARIMMQSDLASVNHAGA
jgi:hypothetical protein